MHNLKTKLEQILEEKNKLNAENMTQDINAFGIQGEIELLSGDINLISGDLSVETIQEQERGEVHYINYQPKYDKRKFIKNKQDAIDMPGDELRFKIDEKYIAEILNIQPGQILNGNTILGVNGDGTDYIDPSTTEEYKQCMELMDNILGIDQDPVNGGMTENDVQP